MGLYRLNLLDRSHTTSEQSGKATFDVRRTINSFQNILGPGCPTVIDISYLDYRAPKGRQTVYQILNLYHTITGFSHQVGLVAYPSQVKSGHLTPEQLREMTNETYRADKLTGYSSLDLVQFVTCWMHPYTLEWESWNQTLHEYFAVVSGFHKPVYLDTSFSYHPMVRTLAGKAIGVDRLQWILHRAYEVGYNGVILRQNHDHALPLDDRHYEILINTLNQINEK